MDLSKNEEKILKYWQKNKIFEKSVERKAIKGDYVFYDGPPFATGVPHYGHIVASLIKDVVPRYWTMNGYRVERKWGWDCHGLPIENIVEKEMGTKSKKDIEKIGIDKFNELCRSKVLGYVDDWEKVVRRMGRWVDMDNAYKTMDLNYMESIWWVFKELWDKKLIYKDYRSMHICPRCETTLSQTEVAEGYRDIKDLSVTVKFKLESGQKIGDFITDDNTYILAWTTTPWTLIGNVALAVGKKIKYVRIKTSTETFIIASDLILKVFPTFGDPKLSIMMQASIFMGDDLINVSYEPLFDYYSSDKKLENKENGWKVYSADFVNTEEGTGVVHIAPAFGEDDMNLGKEKNLPFVQHIGMDGVIKEEANDFAGLHVKPIKDTTATDVEIIKYLTKKELLFSKAKYEHSYPHCWRCDTPLLNYATTSWFVNITKIKDKILKTAKKIDWSPAHIKEGRFGNWLEGARDWSISRQRFWASVIPIWECDKCSQRKVIGSVKELEDLSKEKIVDIHKHIVDKITFPCDCGEEMKRVSDVLDTWFDSGSMPYAQMHYPFENKEKFEKNFPAQFIGEGIDQTRAWFYYMHAIASGIKDSHAFKNVIVNGIVLAEDGKKMAKKLQNYPDPMEVMDKYGADPLRYYLCASPVMKADNISFSEKDLVEQTKFFNILLNVLSFYKMFSIGLEVSDLEKKDLVNILDKWITARLEQTKQAITEKMDNYDLQAVREIPIFIDDLSTWYVRRSRNRFKGKDEIDKMRALKTLRHTLYHLVRVMAPFMPFIAEHIYQELGADIESVHLKEWALVREEWINENVLKDMKEVREVVVLALAKRAELGIRVRQPLKELRIKNKELIKDKELIDLIKEEVNVKEVVFGQEVELDTKITPELKVEGMIRDLVRFIQGMRKEGGLNPQDKIILYYSTSLELEKIIKEHQSEIEEEVTAKMESKKAKDLLIEKEIDLDGQKIRLGIR